LGELNRRTGGELAALAEFGELRAKPFTSSLAASGEVRAKRILTISVGPADHLDRETVLHFGAAAEHRLGGRHARSLAVWLTPLAEAIDGGLSTVAELVARGVVEGSFEPKTLYRDRDDVATAPPVLDELVLVTPGGDTAAVQNAAERGVIIGEGANHARSLSNRSANDVSPEVLAEEARPGDVVRALNGKWVDITNTDAEGRLILGDAMTYAERLGATHIVDVATLTGAVSRAFGHLITGAFGTPQAWYDEVMSAADRAAERYWQIPALDDHVPDM